MAIINTDTRSSWFDSVPDLTARLRMVLVEELSAINTYHDVAKSVRMMGVAKFDGDGNIRNIPDSQLSQEEANKVSDFLEEIERDEIRHAGKLSALMEELDSRYKAEIMKGRAEA